MTKLFAPNCMQTNLLAAVISATVSRLLRPVRPETAAGGLPCVLLLRLMSALSLIDSKNLHIFRELTHRAEAGANDWYLNFGPGSMGRRPPSRDIINIGGFSKYAKKVQSFTPMEAQLQALKEERQNVTRELNDFTKAVYPQFIPVSQVCPCAKGVLPHLCSCRLNAAPADALTHACVMVDSPPGQARREGRGSGRRVSSMRVHEPAYRRR